MDKLPPVCAACMGHFYEMGWIVYGSGLVVHEDRGECEQYARRKGYLPTAWRGPATPRPPVLDGRCHYCGKNALASKFYTKTYKREFCHLSCAEGWAEQQRLDKISEERNEKYADWFHARTRPRY